MTEQQDDTGDLGPSRRSFMALTALAAAVPTLMGGATAAGAASSGSDRSGSDRSGSELKAGAGKAVFTPSAAILPLDKFTSVHDDLHARVLLLESAGKRIALVVLDLTSVSAEAIGLIRTAVTEATGVTAADIMVTVTHCFSAPHVAASTSSASAAAYVRNIVAATKSAAEDAANGLRSARIGYGEGRADVNVNRNVPTADGWWLGVNEQLPSDKGVYVARIDDLDGNPLALLTNYNVQSCVMQDSVMADGNLPITADLAGAAVAHVEEAYPDAVGFWLVGACGDQFPGLRAKRYTIDRDGHWTYGVDLKDAGFALLEAQGERLGNEIVRVSETITRYASGSRAPVRLVTDSVTTTQITGPGASAPVKTATFTPGGSAEVPLWVFRVGDIAFAGVSPELSTSTARAIREASPFTGTFVMSMFEGGAKNMPDRWNYEHFTYEALDGFYIEGTAEKVAARIERTVKSLK
ncbi:hypothetical protein ACIRO1_14810 [Streptomyces sp. NPDC102381]|uniref:hypothetical protein n=1 Tax=Streptomyces sp. NPDC102381 TaxID=3366164 RepID=UPI00381C9B6B